MDSLVTRITMTDQVVERLEAMVLDQELEPGASLPSEAELSKRFGVSRLVVREAVRALQARGLVTVHQGKRPTVSTPNARLLDDFFQFALRRDAGAWRAVLDVRVALETHNARLAATRGSREARQRLTEAFAGMEDGIDDLEDFTAADGAFHAALAAATGNPLLEMLIRALEVSMADSRRRSLEGHVTSGHPVKEVLDSHRHILDAVIHGDAEEAAAAMTRHLEQTSRDLEAYFGR